jgi:hypothetical protein
MSSILMVVCNGDEYVWESMVIVKQEVLLVDGKATLSSLTKEQVAFWVRGRSH